MKKIYLALMCMASLSLMTACGGDKKAANGEAKDAAENENNTEVVENNDEADEQDVDELNAESSDEEFLTTPDKVYPLDVPAIYATGDFKPAATVIFQDTLGDETAGELPSKWDVLEGSAEVDEANGYKYINLSGGYARIFPMVDNGSKDFLPETFTLEFEMLFGKDMFWEVQLFDKEEMGLGIVRFSPYSMEWNLVKTNDDGVYGNKEEMQKMFNIKEWNHFALSFDKGNVKLFVNGKRFANLPNIKQPGNFILLGQDAEGQSHFIRNVRVAK